MKSRELYNDCCYARNELQKSINEEDYMKSKILWFSCLAMLRAIGHILKNVDAKQYNEQFSVVLKTKFDHWKENEPIFMEFIEKERNEILKEYVSSIDIESVAKKRRLVTSNGLRLVTNTGQQLSVNVTMKELVKAKGHLAGETPINVLNNALNWWDKELSELECLTNSKTITE